MNSPFGPLPVSPAASFAWTILWQSTLWLALGFVVSRLWRGRAARAHLLFVLASVAAVASPLLTIGVRGLGWGFLPAPRVTGTEVRREATPPVAAPQSPVVEQPEIAVAQSMPEQTEPAASNPIERSFVPPAPSADSTPEAVPPAEARPAWTIRVGSVLPAAFIAAWLLCSLGLAIRVTRPMLAGRELLRRSVPIEHPGLLAALGEARRVLSVLAEVSLRASSAARCPMIWCWGRQPVLLVPPSAGDQSRISWCSIFCHELAHWLRRDHLSALWTELLVIVLPWQPLAWLSRRQLSALREQACDDWVLASIREATDYAESLVNLVPQNSPTFALPALRSYESLKRRLEHVLAGVRVTPRAGRNWIALASLASLAAAAGIAFAQQGSATTQAVAETSASAISGDQTREIKLLPSKEEVDDVFTLRGQVLKPDGRPAAGARVSMRRQYSTSSVKWRPFAAATANGTGRFELSCHPSQLIDDLGTRLRFATVAAQADGFGAQWTELQTVDPFKPLVLKLVLEFPIRGRVVDLEGKPVEGVTVRLHQVRKPKLGEDLGPWLEAVKLGAMTNGLSAKLGTILPGIDADSEPPILTDRDGHFTFRGIGAERDVRFELRGETIASRQFNVATREMRPLKRNLWFSLTDQVFGASFTLQASPTKPIVGTVRDRATGKPLPGVRVQSEGLAGMLYYPRDGVQTKTDAEGKFRLVGMPKQSPGGPDAGSRNVIGIVPNEDQPYFIRKIAVPDTPGLEPVRLDVDLRRGQWVTGRVTDKLTGKPVVSKIEYFPLVNNPNATLPDFDRDRGDLSRDGRFHTRPDGTYRVLTLPGRAIVGVTAVGGTYRPGVGASAIADVDQGVGFQKYINDPNPRFLSALKEISPAEGAQTAKCDFRLDPGGTVHVRIVDRAGQPVSGVSLLGESGTGEGMLGMSTGPTFDVINLAPHEKRTIEIYHRERQIGKHLVFSFDEKTPRTMTVTVEPCATLVGRLVDADGVAVPGIEIHASPAPGSWPWLFTPIETTRTDGRFECRGLYPGCKYDLAVALSRGNTIDVQFLRSGIEIEPGKVIKLGDVKLKRGQTEAAASEPPSGKSAKGKTLAANGRIATSSGAGKEIDASKRTVITGRVVDEKNQPIARAHVAAVAMNNESRRGGDLGASSELLGEATTGNGGEYRMEIPQVKPRDFSYPTLIARAKDRALAWRPFNLETPGLDQPITLLPENVIHGRFVDLQGQPAAGIHASVDAVLKRGPLGPLPDGIGFRTFRTNPAAWPSAIVSDKTGRFTIHGVGQDHGVFLNIPGSDRFAPQSAALNTGMPEQRGGRDGTYRPQAVRNLKPGEEAVIALSPAQIVEGTVRFADTKLPVPHARLTVYASQQKLRSASGVAGEADAAGRFHITSNPGIQFRVTAYPPPGTPYLTRSTEFDWKAGTTKAQVDVELPRGVLARGKVFEAGSGRPLANVSIQYMPEAKASRRAPEGVITGWQGVELSDAKGEFALPVLAGPGWLLLHGPTGEYVLNVIGGRELAGEGKGGQRHYAHAIQRIDPAASSESMTLSLALTRGQTITGRFFTPDGKPGDEAFVVSRLQVRRASPVWRATREPNRGGRYTITGCAPGVDYPVYFLDSKRHLGATVVIRASESGSASPDVRLAPCGSALARFVDSEGKPVHGMRLMPEMIVTPGPYAFDAAPQDREKLAADADFASNIDESNWHIPESGADGRVTIGNLIPGATYRLFKGRVLSRNYQDFQVESGQTRDLGDIVVEQTQKM